MQLHDVNAPVTRPKGEVDRCAICDVEVKPPDSLVVHEKYVCNSCVGDLLAQLAVDFRRTPRS